MSNKKDKMNSFSVALGLFDYINPMFYSITSFVLAKNMYGVMPFGLYVIYVMGATASLIFGMTIPTVKLLVGLGKFDFKMPVNLVFYVNTGILVSSISIFKQIMNVNNVLFILMVMLIIALLVFILYKTKKFNTAAVLTGAAGYVLIYISLISLAISKGLLLPTILYGLAIIFFVFLCLLGIKSNLNKAKVHWTIEICNVLCQGFVALGTVFLFI